MVSEVVQCSAVHQGAGVLCREAQITVCSQESHFISCHSFTANENLHIRTWYAETLSLFSVTADIHWRAGVLTFIRTMLKKQRDFSIVCHCFWSQHQLPLSCSSFLFLGWWWKYPMLKRFAKLKVKNSKLFCCNSVGTCISIFFESWLRCF